MHTAHPHGGSSAEVASRPGWRLRSLLALVVLAALPGCGSHPEESSGGDAYRNEAQPMPMDEWVTGELDLGNGDTTDWKVLALEDSGKLAIELKADKKGAKILVGVYDKHGMSIGVGSSKSGEEGVTVPVKATSSGKLFVKVEHRGGDKTAYSVRATMDGGGGGGGPDL